MLPWAKDVYAKRSITFAKESPDSNCLPPGPNAGLFGMEPVKFVQTKNLLLILYEGAPTRQVFLDGRPLPKDPNPTWMGYSTGQWDGDTLVVETAGYNDRTWLDLTGHPHSEALRVTERFHRLNTGQMQIEMTFDDPKTYTRPWTISVGAFFDAGHRTARIRVQRKREEQAALHRRRIRRDDTRRQAGSRGPDALCRQLQRWTDGNHHDLD